MYTFLKFHFFLLFLFFTFLKYKYTLIYIKQKIFNKKIIKLFPDGH